MLTWSCPDSVASSTARPWLPLPPIPLEESHRCLALQQQTDLLARVVQYCLLLSPHHQVSVPVSGILSAVWLAAAVKVRQPPATALDTEFRLI